MPKQCPMCGSTPVELTMEPLNLRLIRGALGWRRGFRGPLPQRVFAPLLGRTVRQLRNYEKGRTPIPPSIARRALHLRDNAPR